LSDDKTLPKDYDETSLPGRFEEGNSELPSESIPESITEAIKKLEISNQGLNVILENLDEQLADMRLDPRLEGLIDDLENLFFAYLKTWIKTNTEIINILKKEKQ